MTATGILLQPYQRPEPRQWPFVASPNVDDRPPGVRVSCVVMHATEIERLVDTIGCFRSPATKVSAHFVVDKDGMVVQMVPVSRRAWHAGRSSLRGVAHVNDFSVGIEMINRGDGRDPYPEAQIAAAAEIVRLLRRRFSIPLSRIVTHAQVARPSGRKVDPLGFDMVAFRRRCIVQPSP
jgi:N-acetyl-anhydromuramyl-L-alanine amidase AmpD